MPTTSIKSTGPVLAALALLLTLLPAIFKPVPALAAPRSSFTDKLEHRPYDNDLMRLAEILGAIHYLRELCGADEKQTWRKLMNALVDAEGTTARRRSRLVQKFNRGYRGYQRTYRSCTRPATLAVARFFKEGREISQKIVDKAK